VSMPSSTPWASASTAKRLGVNRALHAERQRPLSWPGRWPRLPSAGSSRRAILQRFTGGWGADSSLRAGAVDATSPVSLTGADVVNVRVPPSHNKSVSGSAHFVRSDLHGLERFRSVCWVQRVWLRFCSPVGGSAVATSETQER
jgi:hypothetical protein